MASRVLLDTLLATERGSRSAWKIAIKNRQESSEQGFIARFNQAKALPPKPIRPSPLLKLNVGGTLFPIPISSIRKTCLPDSLLYRFARFSHPVRLSICTDFLADGSYFFERSTALFRPIYNFYMTGQCGTPAIFSCGTLFRSELQFWGLDDTFTPKCCQIHCPEKQNKVSESNSGSDSDFSVESTNYCASIRAEVWELIENPESSACARFVSWVCVSALFVSFLSMVLGSIDTFQNEDGSSHHILTKIESGCLGIFTAEYCVRLISAPNRRKVFLEPMNLVDLIAILPYFLEQFLYILELLGLWWKSEEMLDVKWLLLTMRLLRVMRVIRVLKMGRHCAGIRLLGLTLRRCSNQLGMSVMVQAVSTMFFASIMYYLEKDHPEGGFTSIPAGFWWCLVTMTTVGYGDMCPQTVFGKIVGGVTMAMGILVVSLPITVVVENYLELRNELLAP